MSTDPPQDRIKSWTVADSFGFSEEEAGFASFVTLMKMMSLAEEPEPCCRWESYLIRSFVVQGPGWRPFPLGFPDSLPSQLVPTEAAESMERRIAMLNGFRKQMEDGQANGDERIAELIKELGPKAWAALRGLCDDLEVTRFDSGECYVMALKLRRALTPQRIANAKLIQVVRNYESLMDPDGMKVIHELAVRLIFRVPAELGSRSITLNQWNELLRVREEIENVFFELFPGNYVVVELRDYEGATAVGGNVVGPTFNDVKRFREQTNELE